MNLRIVDYRISWVSNVLSSLESAFDSIEDMGEEMPWFDGLWQLEYAEEVFGVAFVAAQAYILAATQDLNAIRKDEGKHPIKKYEYYKDSAKCTGAMTETITLVNSIANYYKHHEEWGDLWPDNNTVKALKSVGINSETEFPCNQAACILFGGEQCWKFSNLTDALSDWRSAMINRHTSESA